MIKKILQVLGIVFIVLVVLGGIFLVLVSLGGARRKVSYPGPSYFEAPAPLAPGGFVGEEREISPEASTEVPSRLVIKTGNLNIVVRDVTDSVRKIIKYAEDQGGWVVSSSISEIKEIPSGSVTIRIPAEIFDETMAFVRGLAERVTYEGSQGRDVTEEYIDLKSRLRNLEATEDQLLAIMQRSGTITEVLAVQRELTNVRQDIERTKGRIQYLEQSGKFATITVHLALSEEVLPIPPAEKWRPVYVAKQAWRSLMSTLRSLSYFLIWFGIYLILLVPLGVIVWQVRKFWIKRKKPRVI